jgi:hypothetical protein
MCAPIRMIPALFLLFSVLHPLPATGGSLVINEFMAQNAGTIQDSQGNYDDWIELYNTSGEVVNAAGCYLTDDLTQPAKWRIGSGDPSVTTIPAHGFLLIWADDEASQGLLHANFKLSAGGESIGLYDAQQKLLDSVTFAAQTADVSYGRSSDGAGQWQSFESPTPGKSNQAGAESVVISEIMYHPYDPTGTAEDRRLEWIELFNNGAKPVDMTGLRFADGVEYTFPNVTIAAHEYLVVAADVAMFSARYPGVKNVVGGWTGWLSNSGERIALADSVGAVMALVPYADEGDWAVRELGPVEQNHRGWQWSDQTDGGGSSLELINAALPGECGQNWAASLMPGGTPGQANLAAADNIAPMILKVRHSPVIPRPQDPVTVTARVIDESIGSTTVRLRYRVDRSVYSGTNVYPQQNLSDFAGVDMLDDGGHSDGQAGDGVYGAEIPPQRDGTVIEFYVEAIDEGGRVRTWPAPSLVDGQWQQVTNALYRVDAALDPDTYWQVGGQPLYYIIMTEMERGRLAYIGSHSGADGPDARMNGTFISIDGTGTELCYRTGVRNRGHGTRNGPPNNYHVDFAHDEPWNDVGALNFNCRYTHAQIMGSAIFQMAGIAAAAATPAQVRINGANLAYPGSPMFGVYVRLEAFNDDFANRHFPGDPDGNLYVCFRTSGGTEAELRYEGTNPDTYRNRYFKANHAASDDWSDLIHMVDVLNNAPDATYFEEVSKVINVPQWLRYIAIDSLLLNYETGLRMGMGDDYFMYRGVRDPRFVLIPHDLDTVLDQGNTHGSVDESIFTVVTGIPGRNGVEGLKRFFNHRDVVPLFYQACLDLIQEVFNSEKLDPLFDQVLSEFTPQDRIDAMKQFVKQRGTAVLTQIPQRITFVGGATLQNGYTYARSSTISLAGQANAAATRRVTVNGKPAVWTAWQAQWAIDNVSLLPGINRVVIQAFDANDAEIDRSSLDIWYDKGASTAKAGGSLTADEVWTAEAGPYRVTGNIVIPAGRTLTIEPGATVFLDSNVGFTVHGRLVAQGTEYRRIRFTRMPGTTTQWAGFQIPDSKQDNIVAYADLEFGGSRSHWITTGNNSGSSVGPTARLTVDHATFSGSDTQYFSIWDPQIIIRNSVFADLGSHYVCMAERMPTDGWFIVEGNLFGHSHGDTDIFHLNSVSVKGGPVARIVNNVFVVVVGDIVDDNETDTHIEGNLFMHANVGNSTRSASAAVTTGTGGGSASANNLESQHLTVVRNIFYHNDYGILNKTDAYSEIYNNVFIQNAGAILLNEFVGSNSNQPGRAAYVESCIFWNNGLEADGSSADNGTGTFVNRQKTQLTVNNSIVDSQFLDLGTGNMDADPLFVDADRELYVDVTLPCFSIGFPGFAQGGYLLKGMVPDVHLLPESAARGSGFNGVDMGCYVPEAASIGGVPISPTWRTDAELTVAGTDIYGFKYRVAGPGFNNAWSAEMARWLRVTSLTHSGVTATATAANHGFAAGDVVEVIGADQAVYNGMVTVTAATTNTFSYTLATAVNLSHPDHLDVRVRKPQPIRLTSLANGAYMVSVIKKNAIGVWQDDNQPTTAAWTVDTSGRRLIINEVLAVNETAFEHEGTFPDLVELYYDGPGTLSLAGMSLSDDPADPAKFVFPAGATIKPGEYLVVFADDDTGASGLHLGFALNAEGDAVYLYDRSGSLLDSVEFGMQLPDLSIGRIGNPEQWHLTVPTFGKANIAYPLGDSRTVKINEWLASEAVLFGSDFIELYNPHPLPVDLGGFYLSDTPETEPNMCALRPLSFIAGAGYAVLAADDGTAPSHLGFKLSSQGDKIALLDPALNLIDEVMFGPQTTDVSQGRAPDGSDRFDYLLLPTPGLSNPAKSEPNVTAVTVLAEEAPKKAIVPTSAGQVSDNWKSDVAFDDSGWLSASGAPGGVGYERSSGYENLISINVQSQMYGRNGTCYVRIPFRLDAQLKGALSELYFNVRYDDGFVAWLNGVEVTRVGFTGTPQWNSVASTDHEASGRTFDVVLDISSRIDLLREGDNLLAIQALNNSTTSSDFIISASITGAVVQSAGDDQDQYPYTEQLKLLDSLRVTELMYNDSQGDSLDYIELQNVGAEPLDLSGIRFVEGVDFIFPTMQLAPGKCTVVVDNLAAFQAAYGGGVAVAGEYTGHLSDNGENLVLKLAVPLEAAIMRFRYRDEWYPTTDGGGKALSIVDPAAVPAAWNDRDQWRPADPSPGRP